MQLELDAEALERMDELTLQARKEHEETSCEKERLQVNATNVCTIWHSVWYWSYYFVIALKRLIETL